MCPIGLPFRYQPTCSARTADLTEYAQSVATRLTTSAWIERARSVWGDQYDYSLVDYQNAKTPVRIVCPRHGEWNCNPDNHVAKKRGCPVCGGSQWKTTESFIKDAQRVHGDTYDYSRATYKNARTHVEIVCRCHGVFWQTPDAHISQRQGCPRCRDAETGERSILTESEVHERLVARSDGGGRVELVPGSYKGMNQYAQVTCSEHGLQEPRLVTSLMSSPHPCLWCAGTAMVRGYTNDEYRELLKERYGGRYKILPFEYRGKSTVIRMVCPIQGHGEFELLAGSVHRSPGCPRCAYAESRERRLEALRHHNVAMRSKRFDKWLEAAFERHSDFYDYSQVHFIDQHSPVTIVCPIHGAFSQPPKTHLKSGCRECATADLYGLYSERFFELNPDSANDHATLYYLRFQCGDEVWFKIGITRTSIARRFGAVPKRFVSITALGQLESTLRDAWLIEKELQETHGELFRYAPVVRETGLSARQMRIGPSECFSHPLPDDVVERVFGKAKAV